MHNLEKKLFQLEELLFLSLQTSLTKYISSMIDCNNKQQKFLFYGIQFFKSNYLHEKESNSFSPEDTTHRTTACIACGASNKARMYYFSICTRILQIFKESDSAKTSEQADNLILTTILSALRRRLTPTAYILEI